MSGIECTYLSNMIIYSFIRVCSRWIQQIDAISDIFDPNCCQNSRTSRDAQKLRFEPFFCGPSGAFWSLLNRVKLVLNSDSILHLAAVHALLSTNLHTTLCIPAERRLGLEHSAIPYYFYLISVGCPQQIGRSPIRIGTPLHVRREVWRPRPLPIPCIKYEFILISPHSAWFPHRTRAFMTGPPRRAAG